VTFRTLQLRRLSDGLKGTFPRLLLLGIRQVTLKVRRMAQ
jgi:hypothetical protein